MILAHTPDQIRAAEAPLLARQPEGALMRRAAAAVAAEAVRLLDGAYGRTVLILVGPGHNGGDGLWAGVGLLRRGARVLAWRHGEQVHAAGWAAFRAAGGREVHAPIGTDLVVDALFGIGGRPGLDERAVAMVRAGAPVLAVDVPSGLSEHADAPHVVADVTVTFASAKPVHLVRPEACGTLRVVDLGLGPLGEPALTRWELADLAAAWPVPGPRSDKYSRGVVGIDTGSARYPGAAVLGCLGAAYAGAGMVRYVGPAPDGVAAALPDVTLGPGRVQAHLLGSGWGERADADRVVAEAVGTGLPCVLDAGALGALPDRLPGRCVLTPHAGELARLLGEQRSDVEADPLAAVRAAVERTGATVLLKGATQVVAGPETDRVDVALGGPAWTARAGSGDTLAGIAAALLAAGLDARTAALAAASAQAELARRHPGPWPPQDLVRHLPALVGSW